MKGSAILTIPLNSKYEEQGWVVSDNYDKPEDIKVGVSSTVDTSRIGEYILTYTAADTSGNKTEVIRKVIVAQETIKNPENGKENNSNNGGVGTNPPGSSEPGNPEPPPVEPPIEPPAHPPEVIVGVTTLHLLGTSTVRLEYPATYSEAGFIATDTKDGDITMLVEVTGTVDNNLLGEYTLTYSVTNSGGLTTSVERTIIIEDTTPPVIIRSVEIF